MDADVKALLVELVEKTALLRREMQHRGEAERYAARIARIEQKLSALAQRLEASDPDLAQALRAAWTRPAMSLAFRNAAHKNILDP